MFKRSLKLTLTKTPYFLTFRSNKFCINLKWENSNKIYSEKKRIPEFLELH